MTICLTPDSINYSESQRARNVAACDKLLALLHEHHGDGRPIAAKPVIAPEPAPAFTQTDHEQAGPDDALAETEQPEPEPTSEPVIIYGSGHYIYVQRVVAKHFGVSRLDLIGQSRRKKHVIPRQIAMYLIHDGKRTLPEIGRRFGGRDHSTILHAVRKIESWVDQDLHGMQTTIAALRTEIGQ